MKVRSQKSVKRSTSVRKPLSPRFTQTRKAGKMKVGPGRAYKTA